MGIRVTGLEGFHLYIYMVRDVYRRAEDILEGAASFRDYVAAKMREKFTL